MPSEPQRIFDLTNTSVAIGKHTWVFTHPRSAESLIDEAAFEQDERLPYWADIWPSSRVLADIIVRHSGNGRPALELGSGTGLVACALAVAGYRTTASDYYEASLATTKENVRKNTGVDIETRLFDWRELPPNLGRYDLVVAADVLYERPYGELVANAMANTLGQDGFAILADPGRIALPSFLAQAEALGLTVVEAWEQPYAAEGQNHAIRLKVLRWRESDASPRLGR